ncbi:alpha/beta fold hydrolase [Roseovarius rhodophyticola]|uniref:Alpha/beta hydrolase n=1 Tax=Roseovarius rhodophyticola TaxID=3080827 RepID=A0ABZ2THN4_9RHOB|nr:alpha/beta hydrolase [Roseovarius sp. W115]MDV2931357.1 alpha/beta hydrolase [Roseovarius sp. W115]
MRWITRSLFWLGVAALAVLFVGRGAAFLRESEERTEILPSEGRLVETSEGSIFVWEEGPEDAPMLLFAHGTAAWSGLWAPTLKQMGAEGWRAVAFDMPPFGFSDHADDGNYTRTRQAERLRALVTALGTKPILVAHSVGAAPGVEAVMQDLSAFTALIVVDGALGLGSHDSGKTLPFPLGVKVARDAATALTMTNPMLTRTLLKGLIHVKEAASDEVVAVLTQPLVRAGTTSAYSDWLPSLLVPPQDARSTRPESYAALTLPVVYIWGEEDTVTPVDQGYALKEITPGSELIVLPELGHIPQIEDQDAFLLALEMALGLIADHPAQ